MSSAKITEKELRKAIEHDKLEASQIAEKYHMSVSSVIRRIHRLGLYPTRTMDNRQFKKMIETSIDVSQGLYMLYAMAMETAMDKREEAEEWNEDREEFNEFVGLALGDGQVSLQDPRVNWLEKFANQKDPNDVYLKASAEARACMKDYMEQRKTLMNDQAVERIKEAMSNIYRMADPSIRAEIEKYLFAETIEASVVPSRELHDGTND